MKKVYNLVAVAALSLLTIGASAQQVIGKLDKKKAHNRMVKANASVLNKHSHPIEGSTFNALLYYPYSDSLAGVASASPETYVGQPSVLNMFYQIFNSHYILGDTGTGANENYSLIHNFSVSFDTLLDAVSGTGYAKTPIYIDSIQIPMLQSNHSGNNDTLLVQLYTVTAATGIPATTKPLYSDTIISKKGFFAGNSFFNLGFITVYPKLLNVAAGEFAVTVKYYDESKMDTCAFLYGSTAFDCTSPAYDSMPDTTFIGTEMAMDVYNTAGTVTGTHKTHANSFTNGYQYYTGASPATSNPLISIPSVAYGQGLYYSCSTPSEASANQFQDIAMFAFVSDNFAGVKTVSDNGISVGQNFPNPWNKTTQISYSLTKSSDVAFSVCDITGRVLITNSYTGVTPGQHMINLNANSFSPGVYFYTFEVNGNAVTKKMVITE